ncbi:hypothetical protein IQ10_03593 [Halalkalibacter nanhaiisediminis]|uniref:Uncharacterized protein n=1 Tax=Halalkalibacter nanhaiisediminis TaxID=688079 RepID=A0A562Q856_9BACI|nr:hypothetical protein IQ10_03593 [Halalkalibacter nanhaiisediminis]
MLCLSFFDTSVMKELSGSPSFFHKEVYMTTLSEKEIRYESRYYM